jgi:hypothetical protein
MITEIVGKSLDSRAPDPALRFALFDTVAAASINW